MNRALSLLLWFLAGCGGVASGTVELSVEKPVQSVTVPGGMDGNGLIAGTIAQSLSASMRRDSRVQSARLSALRLRGVAPEPWDTSEAALEDTSRYSELCTDGRDRLGFVHSMEVFIHAVGSPLPPRRMASYLKAAFPPGGPDGPCAIVLTPAPGVNLLEFLPDYEVTVQIDGTLPPESVTLGGYLTLDVVAVLSGP